MSLEKPQREVLTFKPQKIESPGGHRAEFIPERGGIIASLKLRGTEVLYMDSSTLLDPQKSVRGGIPILFPNAGPVESARYPNLPQHGFARRSQNWSHIMSPGKTSFTESLHSNKETLNQYPYKFLLEVDGEFKDNSFIITQSVTNFEEKHELPIAMGLHPYFKVNNADKSDIKFNFGGGEVLEEKKEEWMQGNAVSIDNPKAFAPNAEMPIEIPGLGTLILEASPEYQRIVVWSLPDADFVCIEPFMRDNGQFVDDPELLTYSEVYNAHFSIKLER